MQTSTRLNLESASGLIVDDNSQALDLLASVLTGFGMKRLIRASNAEEAMSVIKGRQIDLIMTDGHMPSVDGYELVRWLRQESGEATRTIPAIVITAHTRKSHVAKARDCGANFIIAKPITPKIILERILWVAQAKRMFLETDTFVGPDRRFKQAGMPIDFPDGRRRDDKPAELGTITGDNLSPDELNSPIAPQRAAL